VVTLMGGDPAKLRDLVGGGGPLGGGPAGGGARRELTAEEKRLGEMVSVVLADTEDVWKEQFRRNGMRYEEPKLVLFSGQVDTACGGASAAVGPFYCPGDRNVYIDLSFYAELARRFGAPGDFAQAYVIAHEVGHHIQNLLGTSTKVHAQQQRVDKATANRLSVRLELQADFLAGVWAKHAKTPLDPGDVEEALVAAQAIGDDRLQQQAQGRVVPDSFTHGTSAQRVAWFRHGYRSGDMNAGNTFDDALFDRVTPR
jgi:hypothetical protein